MDSCEESKTLVATTFQICKIFDKISETDFSKCFVLCNINISRISDFKAFLQFQTPWTHVLWISTIISITLTC